ncbi:hypothetical protein E4P42_04540 [Mycobacterium sp. PS03-16]|uniref:hypothetical protein n=1 Tax=Mycobacterium sp. PS03-16 TaxID=2559611 RepID=UPI00107372C4|nr:hypothetical protein [Mycobacterium sp. PS03-16]TFV60223.1 hypothetical protein E4P42_04540 [Mycobacterium sp. PS03-16]
MSLVQRIQGWRNNHHGWPRYMPGGRVRTSTVGLVVAFIALSWLQQIYTPPAPAPEPPAQQIVPPGFVPDPDYTWVPRTQVQEPTTRRAPTTTTTTTPTPTTTTPTSPTTPTTPTTPTSPTTSTPTTTVTDPDGPGLLPPQTVTVTPTTESPAPLFPGLPVPPP